MIRLLKPNCLTVTLKISQTYFLPLFIKEIYELYSLQEHNRRLFGYYPFHQLDCHQVKRYLQKDLSLTTSLCSTHSYEKRLQQRLFNFNDTLAIITLKDIMYNVLILNLV